MTKTNRLLLLIAFSTIFIACNSGKDAVNPDMPILTISNVEGNEGSSFIFELELDTISLNTIEITVQTVDQSATSGSDYEEKQEVITFAPGQYKQTITVKTLNDAEEEDVETFTLEVIESSNVNAVDAKGVGTINNVLDIDYFFTAKIDGATYNGLICTSGSSACILGTDYSKSYSSIAATDITAKALIIYLPQYSDLTTTTYDIIEYITHNMPGGSSAIYSKDGSFSFTGHHYSKPNSGQVSITEINEAHNFISGTFSMVVVSDEDATEVQITDGRFTVPFE